MASKLSRCLAQQADSAADPQVERARQVGRLVRPIQAATGRDWPAEQWTAWGLALGDLPDSAIKAAVARWLQTSSDNWPMPADVRRLAMEQLLGRLPDPDQTFAAMLRAVKTLGPERAHVAQANLHPLTWAVLEGCGGWQWACAIGADNRQAYLGLWRKQHEVISQRWTEQRMTARHLRPVAADPALVAEVVSPRRLVRQAPDQLIENTAAGIGVPEPLTAVDGRRTPNARTRKT